jgi:DNA-binding IclR family transcriptional regulator
MDITSYEKDILRVLLKRKGWLNTTKIAELTDISWNTAIKYLQRMYNRGWLSKSGNYWKVRR